MFTLTMQFATKDELIKHLTQAQDVTNVEAKITGTTSAHIKHNSPHIEEVAKETTPKKKPAKTPKEVDEPVQAAVDAAPTAPTALTYVDDVRPLIGKVMKAQGRETVIALLDEFGVTIATYLEEDQWPAFIARLNEVIAEGK